MKRRSSGLPAPTWKRHPAARSTRSSAGRGRGNASAWNKTSRSRVRGRGPPRAPAPAISRPRDASPAADAGADVITPATTCRLAWLPASSRPPRAPPAKA
eukprot:7546210-Pyramimonas_sp.AAC.1